LFLKANLLNFCKFLTTFEPHECDVLIPSGKSFEICLIASSLNPLTPILYQKSITSFIAFIVSGCSQFKSICEVENK
jgi:hypothetical protein